MALISLLYGTPWWVYIAFSYLMFVGYKYSKQRTVSLLQLTILPIIMTLWSVLSFYKVFSLGNTSELFIWFALFFGGICIGYWIKKGTLCTVDYNTRAITIPGSYSTILLLLLLFVVKYYVGYSCATALSAQACTSFIMQDMLFSTFIRSVLLGNALYLVHAYFKGISHV